MWRDRARFIAPNEECVAEGGKFLCQIDRGADGTGSVRDDHGIIRWRYWMRDNAVGRSRRNPFNKRDFVIIPEPDEKIELVIRRASFIPPVFDVVQAGKVIGTIRMCSLLRNKYSIDMDGVNLIFRMPLFTVRFFGGSNEGLAIWVVVGPSKKEWNILIKAGVKEWPLVAALAFIHTEWWNYG